MKRHLAMHVYPKSSGMWRRAVRHVRARLSQFTGRRLVSVAVDTSTDRAADVAAEFGDAVEVREVYNDGRQEMVSFPWLMKSIMPESGAVFYCHAKGCTHLPGAPSHLWCDAMAAACLDYPRLVEFALARKQIAGAFRSTMQVGLSSASFHFAGTFWWANIAALSTRQWDRWDGDFWGAESYPGMVFLPWESACLFFDRGETAHLYQLDFWKSTICPAFRAWRNEFRHRGISPLAEGCELYHPLFREWVG